MGGIHVVEEVVAVHSCPTSPLRFRTDAFPTALIPVTVLTRKFKEAVRKEHRSVGGGVSGTGLAQSFSVFLEKMVIDS